MPLVHCLIESILSVIFEKRTNMVVYESSIRNLSLFHIVNMILCFFKAMDYQSVANQYHKHVCSRVPGVLFVLMDSYLKTLAFSWIWMSFANIDRSSIIGDAIYYLNELLQRINDLHNELESTPLGFLPQGSTSFHPLTPTPDTLSCRVKTFTLRFCYPQVETLSFASNRENLNNLGFGCSAS
ncbi:hypothetical protein HID58_072370, partial [Brassica napus]